MTDIFPNTIKADVNGDGWTDTLSHKKDGVYDLTLGAAGGEPFVVVEAGEQPLEFIPIDVKQTPYLVNDLVAGNRIEVIGGVDGDFHSASVYDDFTPNGCDKAVWLQKENDGYSLLNARDLPGLYYRID